MKITKNKLRTIAIMAAVTLLGAMASVHKIHAATIPVTSTADDGTPGTLRVALASAMDGDTIDATGVSGTILLTSGELVVSNSVTILGPGPATLAVDGNAASRVFNITNAVTVSISSLTITNGLAGGTFPAENGGGIYNDHSTLTVSNCTLSGNSAVRGGGVFSDGGDSGSATLTVIASTAFSNTATLDGGGIYSYGYSGNATLVVNGSTLSGNSASGDRGGAIFSTGLSGSAALTVSNSNVSANSAGTSGGGIYNDGRSSDSASAEISNSILSDNSAGSGGGIYNDGSDSGSASMTVTNSILSSNSADEIEGGGIVNDGSASGSATLTVANSTLSDNSAYLRGGGIANNNQSGSGSATLEVANSTLSGNSAFEGGGINHSGGPSGSAALTVVASTLSGNSADAVIGIGGGILIGGASATLKMSACTLSGNSAFEGGGILSIFATLEIGNTILKAGSPGENILNDFGTVISHGFNLSSDAAGGDVSTGPGGLLNATGDQRNTDPKLGPLADNGGPTLTHLPLPGSPAIDGGEADTIPALTTVTDQRGSPRTIDDPAIPNAPFGDGTDIGAVEVAAPPVQHADLLVSLGVDKTSVKQGEQLTYTITVHNFGPDAAANVVVNDTLSSGTTFVSAQANRGNFTTPPTNQTGTVTWNLGDLSNGDAEGAQLVVKVIARGRTTITNTASASTDSSDPNPANNTAAITVSVAAGATGKKK